MLRGVFYVIARFAMRMMMCLNDGSSPGVTGV